MNRYRVGIAGFGWAAGAHLQSFAELPNYEPVAIMSGRKLDTAQIKAEYGVDVTIYNDYDEFLSNKYIDIVDICTPHPFHPEQTIKAAEDGRGLILRMYESQRKRCKCVLTAGFDISEAFRTNLIEDNLHSLETEGNRLWFEIKPYQIITMRVIPAA